MAITPIDIQQQQFKSRPFGYEKYGVDEFLEQVANEMERLMRVNQEVREELARTKASLEEMRSRETMLKETLVTSQKMAGEIKTNARKEAEIITASAQLQGERIVRDSEERRIQLINEIQEIMTVDQVNYIAGLQLTQEDMMTLINDLGIFEQTRPDDGDGGTGFNRPEGLPEGTRPGGGQGGPGGGDVNIDPELLATMQAEREASGGGRQSSRMTIPLVDELISLLEEKAGS